MGPRKRMDSLEEFWGIMLGREPAAICALWRSLPADEQQAVSAHLQRMVSEDGWHDQQRLSARIALDALADMVMNDGDANDSGAPEAGPDV
ncbi:MAG: hypothetical protein JW966_02155 [Anaerolineae bacterium]|nr:hypothetical protein [Anaerolineae bacterium]